MTYEETVALRKFKMAQELFKVGNFNGALELIDSYRAESEELPLVYFNHDEGRILDANLMVSVIVVAYNSGAGLIKCLGSLDRMSQQNVPEDCDYEVILVDNGGLDDLMDDIIRFDLMHIFCPINFGLSEGRNIGVGIADGRIYAFIDDDAVAHHNFIASIIECFSTYDIKGMRGKVLPKDDNPLSQASHYDYGDKPLACPISTEGNSAVLAEAWDKVGGQQPLLFGTEGLHMTRQLWSEDDDVQTIYYPDTIIYHNYSDSMESKKEKKERHAEMKELLEHMEPGIWDWWAKLSLYRKDKIYGNSVIRKKNG